MRVINLILTFLIFCDICLGQTYFDGIKEIASIESYCNVKDSLFKREIAMFNFKGTLEKGNMNTLTEIPLRSCDSNTVNFYKGSTFIHLYFSQCNEKNGQKISTKLDSIFFVAHSHFWVRFPKSAYLGIFNCIPCKAENGKKQKAYIAPFYRAFQSSDKRRIYIYMIAGLDEERYEVTWVVKDSKFYMRTVDII